MQQIQLTNEQVKELESMTRMITPADETELNRAYTELDKKGFIFSGENFMTLIRAYNQAPSAPISVQSVLDFTKKYRDAFEWLSAAEVEFNQLSAQIGPDHTALVTKQLGRHGLVNTPGTEELFNNFNAVVHYYQSQHWQISAQNFEQAIGNLRTSLGHETLAYKPTPNQQAQQKRWDKAREVAPPPTIQRLLEAAKQKAASVAHIVNPDGTRMSDQIMRDFYDKHPEAMETEAPKTPQQNIEDAAEAHWKQQVEDYIRSLTGQNLLQQEAQRLFGQPLHGSWRQTYSSLEIWHQRKKLGAWGNQ